LLDRALCIQVALALLLQVALEPGDALPLLQKLVLVARAHFRDFGAVVPKVDRGGSHRAANPEHDARQKRESPSTGTSDRPLSLDLDSMRELALTNVALRACFDLEPHALDFSLVDGGEPRLLFAFRSRPRCDLLLVQPSRCFALSGKPFGRFLTLAFALPLAFERLGALAFDTPALFAHERFQRK
jgi:hypothetical protein